MRLTPGRGLWRALCNLLRPMEGDGYVPPWVTYVRETQRRVGKERWRRKKRAAR